MFSFSSSSSSFSVSSERIEKCSARNSMHGFEIPPFAAVSAQLFNSSELDWAQVRENYLAGCKLVFKLTESDELKAFFPEFLLLAEEQCSRLCTALFERKDRTMTEAELALPFLLADFYTFAAARFSAGRLEMLLDTEKSFEDAAAFICSLNMPDVLKEFFAESVAGCEKEHLLCLLGKQNIEKSEQPDMHRLLDYLLKKVSAPA